MSKTHKRRDQSSKVAKADAAELAAFAAKDEAASDFAAAMEEVDAMVQDHDNAVQSLVRAAIDALSPDPDALLHVRRLLLLVRESSDELMNTINCKAEDAGRFYVDKAERTFSDRVHAQARRLGIGKAGAA